MITPRHTLELLLFLLALLCLTKPIGLYLNSVFNGPIKGPMKLLLPFERGVYRLCSINPQEEQTWKRYLGSMLGFSLVSAVPTLLILLFQKHLPLNPQGFPGMPFHLALNTTVSFLTNTNWQAYAGESTLSYFSQVVGLGLQYFLSPAVGMAVAVAVIRGMTAKDKECVGNFFVDLVRGVLYVMLPLSILAAVVMLWQGSPQTFMPYPYITTLEGVKQLMPVGPVASQVAVKMLGTNGGGFFNANSAHPFENPTAFSNFFEMLLIFLIPSALIYLLGVMAKNFKHAWTLWACVGLLMLTAVFFTFASEQKGNPMLTSVGCSSMANMEGKETRFGVFGSSLFSVVTTDASCGATNTAMSSLTPISQLVAIVNMLLGEIVFGGIGAGLYGLLIFILLTVFIAGLMVGRTPEYLGKKIQTQEIKWVIFALIVMAFSILGLSAFAMADAGALRAVSSDGPHGFSELFYAYTSTVANNGSAFAGLSAAQPFWTYSTALAMFIGRYAVMVAMLAIAGSLAQKKVHPTSVGTFQTHGVLFGGLLIAIILLVGALTFFPALTLGPVLEHFYMHDGILN